ncbi:MAG: hypothetical protein ABH879_00250 [archaeon]
MKPIHVVHTDVMRAVVPRFILAAAAGMVLYAGVTLNLRFLGTSGNTGGIAVSLITVLIAAELLLTFNRSYTLRYSIYPDRIVSPTNYIHMAAVSATHVSRNIWDRLFRTASIHLEPGFIMKHVPANDRTVNMIMGLIHKHRHILGRLTS